jgi:hypothetical protein
MSDIRKAYEVAMAVLKVRGRETLFYWLDACERGDDVASMKYGHLHGECLDELMYLVQHPPRDRGRPRGSGAAFRDKEDFFAKTFSVIHALEEECIDPTRTNVACELMKRGIFQTRTIDTAETNLKRACRRYRITFPQLVDRARRS